MIVRDTNELERQYIREVIERYVHLSRLFPPPVVNFGRATLARQLDSMPDLMAWRGLLKGIRDGSETRYALACISHRPYRKGSSSLA